MWTVVKLLPGDQWWELLDSEPMGPRSVPWMVVSSTKTRVRLSSVTAEPHCMVASRSKFERLASAGIWSRRKHLILVERVAGRPVFAYIASREHKADKSTARQQREFLAKLKADGSPPELPGPRASGGWIRFRQPMYARDMIGCRVADCPENARWRRGAEFVCHSHRTP